jgi:dGTPase
MVCDIIVASKGIRDGSSETAPALRMSEEILTATNHLRDFLFDNVYRSLSRNAQAKRARSVVTGLYRRFLKHPQDMPPEYTSNEADSPQVVVDYIAGMTDQFALRLAGAI